MKVRAALTALGAIAAMTAAPVAAQNLTGTWELESQTQRGTQNITLTLVQDGSELAGSVTLTFGGRRGGGGGGGGGGPETFDIENGTVDGNSFSFASTITFGDNSVTLSYSGTYEGDAMEGTIEGGRGGGRPFTGERGG
jgi:hypothetical protein